MEHLLTAHYGETILLATRPIPPATQAPAITLAPCPRSYPFSISVVIPAHNEGHGIAAVVRAVREQLPDAELLVIDDYSSDDTAAQAAQAGARVIQRATNMGNGAAVKTGIRAAQGEVVLLMDGDGQMDPQYIPLLLGTLAKGFDMVVGARTTTTQGDTAVRRAGNRLLDQVGSYLVEQPVHDLTSGYRAVRRAVISEYLHLLPNRYSYPTTSTLALMQAGYTVGFVPIESRQRQGGQSGQKLFKNGIKFFLIILRMISLFAPLRVYFPVALAMFGLAVLSFLISFFITDPYRFRLPNSVVALSVGSVVVFMFGLLAEQLAAMRRRPLE
ncbi:MAG: glycosyltransferase [Chloroflexaceae bacterium]|nr:glycosyltransferase [Chloroflexaceae bacterium]